MSIRALGSEIFDPFDIDAAEAVPAPAAVLPRPSAEADPARVPTTPETEAHGRTLAALALVYLRHGDPARAMVLALSGMAMGDLRPRTVLLVAEAMLRAGDPRQSLTVLGRFDAPDGQLSAAPDAAETAARHYLEARALLRLEDAEGARAAFDRALAARPAPPRAAPRATEGETRR